MSAESNENNANQREEYHAIREWLVRLDTKIDFLNGVRETADEANARSRKNEENLDSLKKFLMWSVGILGAGFFVLTSAVLTILFK
jgi:hypothetical protein